MTTAIEKRLAHRKLLRQLRASLAKEAADSARIRELRMARMLFDAR